MLKMDQRWPKVSHSVITVLYINTGALIATEVQIAETNRGMVNSHAHTAIDVEGHTVALIAGEVPLGEANHGARISIGPKVHRV